jgi:quinol monooxygenase YgiN
MAIVLSVVFHAAPGREEDLEHQLKALVPPTREEAGCLQYELSKSTEQEGTFHLYEKFADQAALDAHVAMPHFQAFLKYREGSDPVADVVVTRCTLVL